MILGKINNFSGTDRRSKKIKTITPDDEIIKTFNLIEGRNIIKFIIHSEVKGE